MVIDMTNEIEKILENIPLITTDEILILWEDEPSWLERLTECTTFQVRLNDAEIGWLDWIGNRYAIANLLWDSLLNTDGERDTNAVNLDCYSVSKALSDDGVDRAPCLSEDTGLAKLIWFIGPNEDDEDDGDYNDD